MNLVFNLMLGRGLERTQETGRCIERPSSAHSHRELLPQSHKLPTGQSTLLHMLAALTFLQLLRGIWLPTRVMRDKKRQIEESIMYRP